MKITNVTDWPDHFLRALVSWTCGELEMPKRWVKKVHFGNRNERAWTGRAFPYEGRALIRVRTTEPNKPVGHTRFGVTHHWIDRIEILVAITAHELCHLRQHHDGDKSYRERECDKEMAVILNRFRENRWPLLKKWIATKRPSKAKPKLSAPERREANARKKLMEWEAKKRRANNALKKWRSRVQYYERKHAQAAKKGIEHGRGN